MSWLLYALIAAAILAIFIMVARIVAAYRKATGTRWQRFLFTFKNSETLLWAWLQTIAGSALTALGAASDFLHDSQVDGLMHTLITDSKQLIIYGLGLIGLGRITSAVRQHRAQPAADGTIVAPPPAPKTT